MSRILHAIVTPQCADSKHLRSPHPKTSFSGFAFFVHSLVRFQCWNSRVNSHPEIEDMPYFSKYSNRADTHVYLYLLRPLPRANRELCGNARRTQSILRRPQDMSRSDSLTFEKISGSTTLYSSINNVVGHLSNKKLCSSSLETKLRTPLSLASSRSEPVKASRFRKKPTVFLVSCWRSQNIAGKL